MYEPEKFFSSPLTCKPNFPTKLISHIQLNVIVHTEFLCDQIINRK